MMAAIEHVGAQDVMAVVGDVTEPIKYEIRSPELTAEQFDEMLAELDAICRQARELSTQITLQMVEQKRREQTVVAPLRFPRPV